MADIIDLVSSPSPPPTEKPPQQRNATATTNFANPVQPSSRLLSPDDIESALLAFDDEIDKPTKRRKLSNEANAKEKPREATTKPPTTKSKSLFTFSDEDAPPSPVSKPTSRVNSNNYERKGAAKAWDGEESDPIVFTSSAPDLRDVVSGLDNRGGCESQPTITISDDEEDLGKRGDGRKGREDIEEFSDPFQLPDLDDLLMDMSDEEKGRSAKTSQGLSEKTSSLLASLEARPEASPGVRNGRPRNGKGKSGSIPDENDSDDLIEPRPKPKKPAKAPTADKETKAQERAAAKAQRDHERKLEKEGKQKQKALEKEGKAREKQLASDVAVANKLKVHKKDSTPEMIIDMASSLEGTSVGNQSKEFMNRLGVDCNFFSSTVPNIVKWRRKKTAIFNEALGHWEPCRLFIQEEGHVLCLVTAQDFADMVLTPPGSAGATESLEEHVLRIKDAYPDCKTIYLIEALTPWMRKNRNARNRAYQAEVRRQMEDEISAEMNLPQPSRRRPETTATVDDDTIEDALLRLQIVHDCLIHHTNAAPESAEWIKNFTEHVSTVPYRRERMENNDSAFCMDVGQVKTGDDKADTFVKMLQEVNRITASMAYGIVARYPSVTDLIRAMRRHGPGLLEDVKVRYPIVYTAFMHAAVLYIPGIICDRKLQICLTIKPICSMV